MWFIDADHPGNAKLIRQHTKTQCPEGFLSYHTDLSVN